jgi:hypothetical protein
MAMATHSSIIKAELRHYLEAFRELQVRAVDSYMDGTGVKGGQPAEAAVIISQSGSKALAVETALGTVRGHETVKAEIEQWLLT